MSRDSVRGPGRVSDQQRFQGAQSALHKLSRVESDAVCPVDKVTSRKTTPPEEILGKKADLSQTQIRMGKVLEARKRIREGYYNRAEIKEALTRNMLEDLGLDE